MDNIIENTSQCDVFLSLGMSGSNLELSHQCVMCDLVINPH